jgi:hypothetical protein
MCCNDRSFYRVLHNLEASFAEWKQVALDGNRSTFWHRGLRNAFPLRWTCTVFRIRRLILKLKLIYDQKSWCQTPIWDTRLIFFLLEISFRQLRLCYFVAPSLTRGLVCNLLYNCFWASTEQSLLGRSPAELTTIFYCLIWDSPNLEGQVPVFISPRKRVAQLYPQALSSLFVASYDSQGYGRGILTRLHTG